MFTEAQVAGLLQDYDRDTGDAYYRAVVQNLFFATLNTEIGNRGFSREKRATHRDFSRYRYRREMQDPDTLLALFRRTPFINGGLFDCLDSETATTDGGWRIDCFTDTVTDPERREYGLLSIPNRLFFDADGLITLFDQFTFTVEENTPAEQDVALDPELLGKMFENLLAAVNPETRETARKQTGSYYTPRAVVEYMVDEALVAAVADRVQPDDGNEDRWRTRLRYLLDYADAFDDAEQLFTDAERDGGVRAITDTTVVAESARPRPDGAGVGNARPAEPRRRVAGYQRHVRALSRLGFRAQAVPDSEQPVRGGHSAGGEPDRQAALLHLAGDRAGADRGCGR